MDLAGIGDLAGKDDISSLPDQGLSQNHGKIESNLAENRGNHGKDDIYAVLCDISGPGPIPAPYEPRKYRKVLENTTKSDANFPVLF